MKTNSRLLLAATLWSVLICFPVRILAEEPPQTVTALFKAEYTAAPGLDTANPFRAARSWDKAILSPDTWEGELKGTTYARASVNGIDAIQNTYSSPAISITTSQSSMMWVAELTVTKKELADSPSFEIVAFIQNLIKSPASKFSPDRYVSNNWYTKLRIEKISDRSARIWTIKLQATISSTASTDDFEMNKRWFYIPRK